MLRVVPRQEHECRFGGLRLIALPPGPVDTHLRLGSHVFDVNLNAVTHDLAIDADRRRRGRVPAESVAWYGADSELALRTNNHLWGLVVELDPIKAARLAAERFDGAMPGVRHAGYAADAEAALLGRRIITALREQVSDRLFVEGLTVAFLARGLGHLDDRGRAPATGGTDARIKRACDYARAHLDGDVSIAAMASVAAMSPWHFARCFREVTSETPHAFVVACRIERAKALMIAGDQSIAEIAYACGFASQSHFGQAFRRATGTTPARWRRDAAR